MAITLEMLNLIQFGACCGCISLVLWCFVAVDRFLDWSIDKKTEKENIERRLTALEEK